MRGEGAAVGPRRDEGGARGLTRWSSHSERARGHLIGHKGSVATSLPFLVRRCPFVLPQSIPILLMTVAPLMCSATGPRGCPSGAIVAILPPLRIGRASSGCGESLAVWCRGQAGGVERGVAAGAELCRAGGQLSDFLTAAL
jgi:hypothetical protein